MSLMERHVKFRNSGKLSGNLEINIKTKSACSRNKQKDWWYSERNLSWVNPKQFFFLFCFPDIATQSFPVVFLRRLFWAQRFYAVFWKDNLGSILEIIFSYPSIQTWVTAVCNSHLFFCLKRAFSFSNALPLWKRKTEMCFSGDRAWQYHEDQQSGVKKAHLCWRYDLDMHVNCKWKHWTNERSCRLTHQSTIEFSKSWTTTGIIPT